MAIRIASTPLPKAALRAGDLLNNRRPTATATVIAERWVDSAMNRYVGYEQSDGGTHHRSIPYASSGTYIR
jgi:hypothetical protein